MHILPRITHTSVVRPSQMWIDHLHLPLRYNNMPQMDLNCPLRRAILDVARDSAFVSALVVINDHLLSHPVYAQYCPLKKTTRGHRKRCLPKNRDDC